MDAFGDHAVSCKTVGGPINRHDRIRDVFVHYSRISGCSPLMELVGYISNQKSRVGDFILPFQNQGNEVLYDVSCFSSLHPSRVSNSARERGFSAKLAVKSKLSARSVDPQSGMMMTSKGLVKFVPLGFESLGGFSKESVDLLRTLAIAWEVKLEISRSLASLSMARRFPLRFIDLMLAQFYGEMLAVLSPNH